MADDIVGIERQTVQGVVPMTDQWLPIVRYVAVGYRWFLHRADGTVHEVDAETARHLGLQFMTTDEG